VFEQNVYEVRKRMGAQLAIEHPAPTADLVIPVPDSGVTAALGFAGQANLPLEMGLIRNHYIGRTFIEPSQSIRDFGVKLKLNPNPRILEGKSVVVVDDSIVRGTTSRKLMSLIRQAGAKEIHLRISAPPTQDPCYYGIDTPSKSELIASYKSIEEIRQFVGVDSLGYLSIDGLYKSVQSTKGKFCDACFTGEYPLGTPSDFVSIQNKRRQPQLL
jgi:amidophosphoribosyltransferase